MSDTAALLTASLHEVFGNRDAASRRAAIDRVFAQDVRFVEPEGTVVGRDALEARAATLIGQAPPGFTFREDGPAYVDGDFGLLGWALGPVDGEPVLHGVDILTVTGGFVSEIRTVLAS